MSAHGDGCHEAVARDLCARLQRAEKGRCLEVAGNWLDGLLSTPCERWGMVIYQVVAGQIEKHREIVIVDQSKHIDQSTNITAGRDMDNTGAAIGFSRVDAQVIQPIFRMTGL